MLGLPQWVKGSASRQAHVGLPPDTVEEEHGRAGFYGAASHLYRIHPPTGWTEVDGPAAHRAFDLTRLPAGDDLWPTAVLANADVAIGFQRRQQGRPEFLRNADGDECHFVHAGAGVLRTEYGPLRYRPGDYLVVPRGTTYRFEPESPTDTLVVESLGDEVLGLPERGLLGRHALFDPAVVEVPEPEAVDEAGDFVVVVRREGRDTRVRYPFHPCDVVGWKGDVAPLRLNVADFRPVVSPRYHLPPSAHTTFVGAGFVICTFAPRPMEEDPEALRLPFYHRNIDYDEVLFYHSGSFFSRAGIGAGMLTFHPHGLHHGPQPAAVARDREAAAAGGRRVAEEYAVMVDTRRPLAPTPEAEKVELEGYVRSWSAPGG